MKSSDRTGLGEMCVKVEAKGPQRVPVMQAHCGGITINSADNNPLDFEDKYSGLRAHIHTQAPLGGGGR